jgi:GT2 family glycosyltransferase
MIRVDLVTVYHNQRHHDLHLELFEAIKQHEPEGGYRFIGVDNRVVNRGFARACNIGALHPDADAPVIGFLNPDVLIHGPFIDSATAAIDNVTVITGCRFGKPAHELQHWGVTDWVCGAAMFVQRRWFTVSGGFDEQFVWAWEETDLIRRAESQGLACRSLRLPILHTSPGTDTETDSRFKLKHFTRGAQRYHSKWEHTGS